MQATEITRERESLVVRFGPSVDETLLNETVAIERRCCPSFDFDYGPDERVLKISVVLPGHAIALDALESALAK